MIYGIGVDLLRIERGEKLWARFGEHAAAKLLHPAERAVFESLPEAARGRFLARAFTAKEAFVKALGTGFIGVGFVEIGAVREPSGRPRLVFAQRLQDRLNALGVDGSHLSFSDEAGLITAFVVLEQSAAPVASDKLLP